MAFLNLTAPSLAKQAFPPLAAAPDASRRALTALGAAAGLSCLSLPKTAFADEPDFSDTARDLRLDGDFGSSWIQDSETTDLENLIGQAPQFYHSSIYEDDFNFSFQGLSDLSGKAVASFQSSGKLLDGASALLGAEEPVFTGAARDDALLGVSILGLLLFNYGIFIEYRKLMLRPGVAELTKSLASHANIIVLAYLATCIGMDAYNYTRLTGETGFEFSYLNKNVIFAYYGIWFLFTRFWPPAGALSTKSSAFSMWAFLPQKSKQSAPVIESKGEFLTPLLDSWKSRFKIDEKTGSAKVPFALNAENVASNDRVAALSALAEGKTESLKLGGKNVTYFKTGLQTSITTSGDLDVFETFVGLLREVRTADPNSEKISIAISATTSKNLGSALALGKRKVHAIATGKTVLEGAKLIDLNGEEFVSRQNVSWKGEYRIVKGRLLTHDETHEIEDAVLRANPDGSVTLVSGKIDGVKAAEEKIFKKAKLAAGSFFKRQDYQNARTQEDRELPLVLSLIKGTVESTEDISPETPLKKLRKLSHPEFEITFKGDAGIILGVIADRIARRQVTDAYIPMPMTDILPRPIRDYSTKALANIFPGFIRKNLRKVFDATSLDISVEVPQERQNDAGTWDHLIALASQKRRVFKTPQSPIIPISRPVLQMIGKDSKMVTLSFSQSGYEKHLKPTLHFVNKEPHVVLAGIDGVLKLFERNGRYQIELPVDRVERELLNHNSVIARLARTKDGFLGNRHAMIEVANDWMIAADVWKPGSAEKTSRQVPVGSELSLEEFLGRRMPGLARRAFDNSALLASNVYYGLNFGRNRHWAALTVAGGLFSSGLIGAEMIGMGFRDPEVIVTSAIRSFFTGGLNRLFGPGLTMIYGASGYSAHIFFGPSMLALVVWEMPNQVKERNVLLYDEHVQYLLGEDRPDERAEKTYFLVTLEKQIHHAQPEDKVRSAILYKRIANGITSSFSTENDGRLLMDLYKQGRNGVKQTDDFSAAFLLALIDDQALSEAVDQDPQAATFFLSEAEKYREGILALASTNISGGSHGN